MNEIRVPLNQFRLPRFLDAILTFVGQYIVEDGDPVIALADECHCLDYDGAEDSTYEALLDEGKTLFCPFSTANDGDSIPCADGQAYLLDEEEFDEDDLEVEEETFWYGEESFLGLLVKKDGPDLVFQPAQFSMGMCTPPMPDSADPISDCGIFEQPITIFIKRFVD